LRDELELHVRVLRPQNSAHLPKYTPGSSAHVEDVRLAGDHLQLAVQLRNPERVDDVGRLELEAHALADRDVDLVRRREPVVGVLDLPPEHVAAHQDRVLDVRRRPSKTCSPRRVRKVAAPRMIVGMMPPPMITKPVVRPSSQEGRTGGGAAGISARRASAAWSTASTPAALPGGGSWTAPAAPRSSAAALEAALSSSARARERARTIATANRAKTMTLTTVAVQNRIHQMLAISAAAGPRGRRARGISQPVSSRMEAPQPNDASRRASRNWLLIDCSLLVRDVGDRPWRNVARSYHRANTPQASVTAPGRFVTPWSFFVLEEATMAGSSVTATSRRLP
jgi:hypothetical protein